MNMNRFTELMHNLSGALMLIGQTMISAFFVIVILILVLAVEIQRVAHGIQLFEQSAKLAYLGAFVLVMMLLTLEFVIHYIESKTGYHQQRKSEMSVRIFFRWFKYFVGWSDDWQARLKSPADTIKSYSRLLTMTILALALGGSMSDALSSVSGNWIQGLQTIALDSSLLEIVEWTGGLLFALALVVGAQRLTAYVAQRASETLVTSSAKIAHESRHDIVQDDSTVTQPVEAKLAVPTLGDIVIAEWVIDAETSYTETCEDCGWTSDEKDSPDSAARALRAHQARYCPILFDTPQPSLAQ